MNNYVHVTHTFEPVFNRESEILILGSFPSVKSREQNFYYCHPQNRFWKVLSAVLEESEPSTIEDKKVLLLKNKIALWDVIEECDIVGSSDSSIRNVKPADIKGLIEKTKIKTVIANGQTAGKLYNKYIREKTEQDIIVLPSTSPANAACPLEQLKEIYTLHLLGGKK